VSLNNSQFEIDHGQNKHSIVALISRIPEIVDSTDNKIHL